MTLRLTGTLVLVLGIAAMASASAFAGNGHGNGNGNGNDNGKGGGPAAAVGAIADHGNSANAPGHQQADAVQAPTMTAPSTTVAVTSTTAQEGVKPANDTAHDTHAAAASDETKLYGNGKTAGQIAMQKRRGRELRDSTVRATASRTRRRRARAATKWMSMR